MPLPTPPVPEVGPSLLHVSLGSGSCFSWALEGAKLAFSCMSQSGSFSESCRRTLPRVQPSCFLGTSASVWAGAELWEGSGLPTLCVGA